MHFFGRRKYSSIKIKKKDLPGGLWQKCPSCNEIVYQQEIEQGKGSMPEMRVSFKMGWKDRINMLLEPGTFEEWDADLVSGNPLNFDKYEEKSRNTRLNRNTGRGYHRIRHDRSV